MKVTQVINDNVSISQLGMGENNNTLERVTDFTKKHIRITESKSRPTYWPYGRVPLIEFMGYKIRIRIKCNQEGPKHAYKYYAMYENIPKADNYSNTQLSRVRTTDKL